LSSHEATRHVLQRTTRHLGVGHTASTSKNLTFLLTKGNPQARLLHLQFIYKSCAPHFQKRRHPIVTLAYSPNDNVVYASTENKGGRPGGDEQVQWRMNSVISIGYEITEKGQKHLSACYQFTKPIKGLTKRRDRSDTIHIVFWPLGYKEKFPNIRALKTR
jgi:hypothetical protein